MFCTLANQVILFFRWAFIDLAIFESYFSASWQSLENTQSWRHTWRFSPIAAIGVWNRLVCHRLHISTVDMILCLISTLFFVCFGFLRATVILRLGHASPSQFSVKNLLLAKSLFVFTTSSLCFHSRYVPHPRECPLSLLTPNIPLVNLSTDCYPFPRNIVRRV